MFNKLILALSALYFVTAVPAMADGGHKGHGGGKSQWQQKHHHHSKPHQKHHKKPGKQHHGTQHFGQQYHGSGQAAYYHTRQHGGPSVIWYGGQHWQPQHHRRPVVVVRKHAQGYGQPSWQHHDDDWAVYAILALQIAEALSDNQRQHHHSAQRRAVSAPLGDSIRWNDGGAGGSIVATREGNDGAGRYCREFQQEIFVGNQRQSGYGVACRQPDGAWEIAS